MIWPRCVSFILLRRIPDHINMICVHGNRFPNGWSRRRFWNNLNPVSSFPMTNKELLTMAFSPLPIGVGYLSKPSLVSKQPLICAYWPSCTWSYPNSSNDVAALGISFPRHTSLSTLMRSFHEEYAVCRDLDRFQIVLGMTRFDQSLFVIYEYLIFLSS